MMQNNNQNSGPSIVTDTDESLSTLQARITGIKNNLFSTDLSDKGKIFEQVYKDVEGSYNGILNTTLSIDQKFSSVINQMGRGVEFSRGIKLNFTDAADEVIRLGGSQQEALSLQETLIKSTQKNLILTGDMGKELYAATKVTGVEAGELLNAFLDSGKSIDDIGDTMYEVVKTARDMGVSAKVVSAGVVGNLDKLNRFGFENGVEGLTRMAAKAATLRISMESVFRTAEDLMSPEKAVELSASLQRLGVASGDLLDPLRLMDLAQNDVGELQNQLSGLFKQYTYFDEKSQSFQIMPGARRELKAVADELGYDIKEVNKMALAGADLDKKLSEISFGNLKIDEDTQEQIANLATLNKETGKYEITTKSGDVQSLQDFISTFEGNEEGLKTYLTEQEQGTTPEEKLVNLAEEQLSSTNKMIAILNTMKQSMGLAAAGSPLGDTILKTIKDYAFKPQEIVSKIAGPQGTVGETIRGITPEDLQEISKGLIRGDLSVMDKLGLSKETLFNIVSGLKDDVIESTTIDKQVQQVQTQTQTPMDTQTQKPEETQPTPINFTPSINLQGINIPKPQLTTEEIGNKAVLPKETKIENQVTQPTQMFVMDETNSNLVTLNETLLSINETILIGDDKTKQIQDLLVEHLPKIDTSINDFITLYNPEKIDLETLTESLKENKNTNNPTEQSQNTQVGGLQFESLQKTMNENIITVGDIGESLTEYFSKQKELDLTPIAGEIKKIEYPEPNVNIETTGENTGESLNDFVTKLSENFNVELDKFSEINTESKSKINFDEINNSIGQLNKTISSDISKTKEVLPKEPIVENQIPNQIVVPNNEPQNNFDVNFGEKLLNEISLLNQPITQVVTTETPTPVINNEQKPEDLNRVQQTVNIEPIENSLKEISNIISLNVNKSISVEPPKLVETKIESIDTNPKQQTENKVETQKTVDINHTITIDVKGNGMDNGILNTALNNTIFKQKLIK